MTFQERIYPESRFGGYTDRDGTVAFYTRINALLTPTARVLDVGCGRGASGDDKVPLRKSIRALRGRVARVIGLDISTSAAQNPFLDEFRLIEPGQPWPVASASVDLVLADWVMEHLHDPHQFIREARRVLAPKGFFCLRTTNSLGYIGALARVFPSRFHAALLARAQRSQPDRRQEDVFPTVHRCNTIRRLRNGLHACGFDAVVYGHDAEPRYCDFSVLAYATAAAVHKITPGRFKTSIFAFAQRAP